MDSLVCEAVGCRHAHSGLKGRPEVVCGQGVCVQRDNQREHSGGRPASMQADAAGCSSAGRACLSRSGARGLLGLGAGAAAGCCCKRCAARVLPSRGLAVGQRVYCSQGGGGR